MDQLLEAGLEATRWLQATYPQLQGIMRITSQLGEFDFYMAFLLLIYWNVNKSKGKHLAYLLALGILLVNVFKHALRAPRPYWLDGAASMGATEGYGIPSGHATTATLTYTYLAVWLRRRWVSAVCIAMILLMAISRVYLGQHFLHDVAAGLLLGGMVLVGYWLWGKYARTWFQELILGQRFWVAVAVPFGLGFLYLLGRIVLGEPDLTVAWADLAAAAELNATEEVVSNLAILLGLGMGFMLEPSRVRFQIEAAMWKRVVRYLLGLAVALGLLYGLRSAFAAAAPVETAWVVLPLRFVRYLAVSLWASLYAPMFFVRVGLATAAPEPELRATLNRIQPSVANEE